MIGRLDLITDLISVSVCLFQSAARSRKDNGRHHGSQEGERRDKQGGGAFRAVCSPNSGAVAHQWAWKL